MRSDMGNVLLQLVAGLALTIAFFAAFLWWSRRSLLRLLPTLPDFEGKECLADAGRWDLVYVGAFALLYLAAPAMPLFLPVYGFTAMTAMKAAAMVALAASLLCRGRESILAGSLLGAPSMRGPFRKQPFDLDQWLSRRDCVVRRHRLAAIPFGLLALVWAAMIPSMYTIDRSQIEVADSEALQIALGYQLAAPDVAKVYALTPPPAMPSALFSWRSKSDEIWLGIAAKYGSGHVLLVQLKSGATEARASGMLAAGQKALAGLRRKERWAIWVKYGPQQAHRSRPRLQGWYEPGATALS